MTGGHHWERWGHLAERYRDERPRKVLARDGGDARGIMTLGVLAQFGQELREAD